MEQKGVKANDYIITQFKPQFCFLLNLFFVVVSRFTSTSTVNHPMSVKTNAATDTTTTSVGALYPHGIVPLPQGVPVDEIISRLGGGKETIEIVPLTQSSAFVKPQSIMYSLDGELSD